MRRETAAWILAGLLLAFGIYSASALLGDRWDRSVAASNLAAEKDTVRIYRSKSDSLTVAASIMQFQLPSFNVTDSIAKLQTSLGIAVRDQELTVKALTRAEVSFEALQSSLDQLVEMDVFSPTGRRERLAAFVLDEEAVAGEIVVTIPADTALAVELETHLQPQPFILTYALGCTPLREAVATFETPSWIIAQPRKGQVDPAICHGERPSIFSGGLTITPGGALAGSVVGLAVGLLIGAI